MDRLSCLLAALLLLRQAESVVWEFGQRFPGLGMIDRVRGKISALDSSTHVYIDVPPCKEIKYLVVEVFNKISTPTVTFNKQTSIVTIVYKHFQISQSEYDITALGKLSSGYCKSGDNGEGRRGGREPAEGGYNKGGGGGYNQGGGGGYN